MNSASLRTPDIAVRALKPRSASHGSLENPDPARDVTAPQVALAPASRSLVADARFLPLKRSTDASRRR